ncbi:MAG: DUF1080 domain-containing protein [Verrucomicrobiales bacterium]|nr:DUF1080 domain-containing protein [Verrucomicrobiales bacterium]
MTNRLLIPCLLLYSFSSFSLCAQEKENAKPDPLRTAGAATLERIENAAEWSSLFNGKDLSGWQGDTEKYVVEDGVLVCQKGGKVLETEKQYSDFVFRFQFKLTESGNNGLGIRVPSGGHASRDGMELQILDHRGDRYHHETKDGKRISWLKPWQVHGSIYGVYPARTGYLKPLEEWNEQVVLCIESHLMIILNGAVIVDTDLSQLTAQDGKRRPGLDRRSGHIQFAGHNDRIEFRGMEIAEFAPSPTSPKTDADNTPPEGFEALFNGKDLQGWKGLAHKDANKRRELKGKDLAEAQAAADDRMREHWSVVEGILTYDGNGDSLCTDRDYGDFEMYVDWKIPPGADSGIYLRGTPQIQIWDPWDPRTKDGLPETAEGWVEAYRNGRNLGSGGLWNNKRASNRPLKLADKKPGEWNTFLIRMVGNQVSIWLNDTLVVDRTELENYWDREGDRDLPLPRADQIELQHHGSELFFKNLYLRELPY